jgi:hypothetical protein
MPITNRVYNQYKSNQSEKARATLPWYKITPDLYKENNTSLHNLIALAQQYKLKQQILFHAIHNESNQSTAKPNLPKRYINLVLLSRIIYLE